MALIDPDTSVKVEIPHEPGEWVEYRPLIAGDLERLAEDVGISTASMIACAVIAWSYPAEPSLENVKRLDVDTYNWLAPLVTRGAGMRSVVEKKDLNGSSSPTTAPARARSRASSST